MKEDIGLPREGTRSKAFPLEQARTYDRDWYGIEPPTAEELEKPTRIIATLLNETSESAKPPGARRVSTIKAAVSGDVATQSAQALGGDQ